MFKDTPAWVKDAIFYQIFPERFANGNPDIDPPNTVSWDELPDRENFFGGDLQGIMDKLGYLQDLGINAIYLNPIFKADTNHKYDTVDYFEINPSFGDKVLFKRFVAAAHEKGIRIILDAVFNHCGVNFEPFKDLSISGDSSRYKDWFLDVSFPIETSPPSYQTCGGTWYLPKLNVLNPDVEKYLLDVSAFWIREYDIDGWRLDVPWKAPLSFWKKFRKVVKDIKPDAYIVGEIWRWPELWLDGSTCDGVMNYTLRNHLLDYCVSDHMDAEDFDYEVRNLLEMQNNHSPFQLNLLAGHDTARIRTICKDNIDRQIIALVFIFTFIGAPLIYYGDEIGMEGGDDPDCRRPMIWDASKWNERLNSIYRLLINTRKEYKSLRYGEFTPLLVFNGIYAYKRHLGDEEIIIVLNPREERKNIAIPLKNDLDGNTWIDIMSNKEVQDSQGHLNLDKVPSQSTHIFIKKASGK